MVSPESKPGHEERGASSAADMDATKILVVDDDTAWLANLQTWLADAGFRVVGISRGEWVLQAVEFHAPDAVVLDVHLPGADGLDILRQLRRREPRIPVVVMTAFGGFEVEERARRLGAAEYFDKPFRLSDLISALRRVRRFRQAG